MNIFVLDSNLEKCAEYHNDYHVRKQVMEYAQMLSTVKRKTEGKLEQVYRIGRDKKLRKLSLQKINLYVLPEDRFKYRFGLKVLKTALIPINAFENHPCTKWVAKSVSNYQYLYRLYIALCNEYYHRFGKINRISWYAVHLARAPKLPQKHLTTFYQAMPDKCKSKNAIAAYRTYYLMEKLHLAIWTKRCPPPWFTEKL